MHRDPTTPAQNVGSASRPRGRGAKSGRFAPTLRELAWMFSVSPRSITTARQVLRAGCADLIASVNAGSVSLNLAVQIARFAPSAQRLILREMESMTARERTAFVRSLIDGEVAR